MNTNAFYGATFSLAFTFDNSGGFDIQFSYAFAGVDNTHSFGVLDVGAGVFVQYTKLDSVDSLLGISSSVGVSGGAGPSVGLDAISAGYVVDNTRNKGKASPDGVQFTVGYGIGVDVHIVQSYTRSLKEQIKSMANEFISSFVRNGK